MSDIITGYVTRVIVDVVTYGDRDHDERLRHITEALTRATGDLAIDQIDTGHAYAVAEVVKVMPSKGDAFLVGITRHDRTFDIHPDTLKGRP